MLITEVMDIDLVYVTEDEILEETATRQVRRYGNKMKFQYRCHGGAKDGKLSASATDCGKRKNPARVRAGKMSARIKKRERVRKTKFTKRKTLSQLLVRRNKMLKGPTAKTVTAKNNKVKSDNITTMSSKGTE